MLALIIVVAAFTVVATLIMVVLDKKKEIAVLKAMGATDDAILRIFLYQGGDHRRRSAPRSASLLGFAVCKGLLVYGFPLDPKVYFISSLPVEVRPQEFLLTGVDRDRHLHGGDDHPRALRGGPPARGRLPRAVIGASLDATWAA